MHILGYHVTARTPRLSASHGCKNMILWVKGTQS